MPLISLPNELLDNIVDKIAYVAPGSLKALALVSPRFLGRCRYHLFHTVRFSTSQSNSRLRKMLRTNPSLFHYPRTLSITQCFDLLLYDEFVVDGGFLGMVEQLDGLRNLDIIDEEHPDSIPHWEDMPVSLQKAYQMLLARPLIHLSICLPKGFPDHLVSSIRTLQELSIDDTTEFLRGPAANEVQQARSDPSWRLTSLHHCHRGDSCMPLLRSMSPPHAMFAKLTHLTIDITRIEGHVFAWSKMLPAFRKHLLSLTLRYTGPSSRYPGSGNKDIVSASLKDVTEHARTFPSFPRLRYLNIELHSFNNARDPPQHPGLPNAIPEFHPLFLNSILSTAPQRSLVAFSSELNWTAAHSNYRWHHPDRRTLGKVIYGDRGWRQLDETLSSHELFPNLTAVRMRTAMGDRGTLFMSYDDRTPVSSELKSQVVETMEKTKGRVLVFDAGDEFTQIEFEDFVETNK